MAFSDASRALQNQLRGIELNVLVWGPGAGAGEYHAKRIQIRDELRKHFIAAEISFSEDLQDLPEWGSELEHNDRELWHFAACNVCVVLDSSKGAGEEIAHFVGTAHAHKLLILTHEKYKAVDTFPAALRKHQNQVFYSDEEFTKCDVVRRVINHVLQVALARLMKLQG